MRYLINYRTKKQVAEIPREQGGSERKKRFASHAKGLPKNFSSFELLQRVEDDPVAVLAVRFPGKETCSLFSIR